jgi:hypothetical protein
MRHRLVSGTGLGNPEKAELTNQGKLNKKFAEDALKAYFEQYEGFDFKVTDALVLVGIEPSYQYDPMLIISIERDKNKSYIKRGKAWGPYGSQVVKSIKYYGDYKLKSKFVKFVDKWHQEFFGRQK